MPLNDNEYSLLAAVLATQDIKEEDLMEVCKQTQEKYLKIKEMLKKNNQSDIEFSFGSISPSRRKR